MFFLNYLIQGFFNLNLKCKAVLQEMNLQNHPKICEVWNLKKGRSHSGNDHSKECGQKKMAYVFKERLNNLSFGSLYILLVNKWQLEPYLPAPSFIIGAA